LARTASEPFGKVIVADVRFGQPRGLAGDSFHAGMFGRCVPTNSPFSPITFTFTKGNEGEGNHTSTVHHFFRSPSLEGNSEGNRETRLEADLRAITFTTTFTPPTNHR
jgi:hypothetical protein